MYNFRRLFKEKVYKLHFLFYFTIKSRKRKEKQVMQDISNELAQIIHDKQCSPLLAFIVLRDEFHIQESKSNKESCGRLRDTRNLNFNK